MSYSFNKINNKVLMFDPFLDKDKIIFNHYIMRKENLTRFKNNFKKGEFPLSITAVMKDFNVSRSKAYRMIKEFEQLGIIKCIVKGKRNSIYSVYEYVLEQKSETNNETNNETSKKENIKRDLKKEDMYVCVIDYLNKKANKNFKHNTQKTKSIIDARINEGFAISDFYKVIDVKCSQWMYCDMNKYLRPETLFSNKFEGYLNECVDYSLDKNEEHKEAKVCEIDAEYEKEWDIEFDY